MFFPYIYIYIYITKNQLQTQNHGYLINQATTYYQVLIHVKKVVALYSQYYIRKNIFHVVGEMLSHIAHT